MSITLQQITLKNIKAFIQGYVRKWMIDFFQKKLSHINEQVMWRIDQVAEKSPEGLIKGECQVCHCTIPELFFADKACSRVDNPCYPKMKSSKEWITFKNINNIK